MDTSTVIVMSVMFVGVIGLYFAIYKALSISSQLVRLQKIEKSLDSPVVTLQEVILVLGDSDEWVDNTKIKERLNHLKQMPSGSLGVSTAEVFIRLGRLEASGFVEANRNESGEHLPQYRLTKKGLSNFESLFNGYI